eukprot:15472608-Alexandrium_andersonii.AAC.1
MSASLVGSEMCIRDSRGGDSLPGRRFAAVACSNFLIQGPVGGRGKRPTAMRGSTFAHEGFLRFAAIPCMRGVASLGPSRSTAVLPRNETWPE